MRLKFEELEFRYAFFGSPWFAAIILEKLIAGGFVPSVVVCNPDRPTGRKQLLTAPAVKQRIMNYESRIKDGIEILQPEKLDVSTFNLKPMTYDLFIVATYGKIISKPVFALPRFGTIGVHHSLLPLHRGPTPIQSAILAGDAETGTTLFFMDNKIDHGPVLANGRVQIANSTYIELETRLAELSGDLLVKMLPNFLAGKITPSLQDESKATYTKKFITQDAFIDEKYLAAAELGEAQPRQGEVEPRAVIIDRKIRALNPEPGTWTLRNGKRVKLLGAKICGGKLVLTKIQIEGKKPQEIG